MAAMFPLGGLAIAKKLFGSKKKKDDPVRRPMIPVASGPSPRELANRVQIPRAASTPGGAALLGSTGAI